MLKPGSNMKILKTIYCATFTAVLSVCLLLSTSVSAKNGDAEQKNRHGSKTAVYAAGRGSSSGNSGAEKEQYHAGEISDHENVAAWVNGVPIDPRSLQWAMEKIRKKERKAEEAQARSKETAGPGTEKPAAVSDAEKENAVRQQALDRLINEELAVQEARRRQIRPASGAVSSVLARLRSNMESPSMYDKYLSARHITEAELRKSIARDNIFKQIMVQEVLSRIRVDLQQVKAIYEKNRAEYTFPEKVVITDLHFLPVAAEQKIRAHAEQILEKLRSAPGADLAKLEPDGTFLVRTIHVTEESEPDLYFAVWDMEPGDISDVITVKDGLHIISVKEKKPEREMTFEEARPRIEYKLIMPEYEKLREKFYQSLRSRAEIIIPGKEPKGARTEKNSNLNTHDNEHIVTPKHKNLVSP